MTSQGNLARSSKDHATFAPKANQPIHEGVRKPGVHVILVGHGLSGNAIRPVGEKIRSCGSQASIYTSRSDGSTAQIDSAVRSMGDAQVLLLAPSRHSSLKDSEVQQFELAMIEAVLDILNMPIVLYLNDANVASTPYLEIIHTRVTKVVTQSRDTTGGLSDMFPNVEIIEMPDISKDIDQVLQLLRSVARPLNSSA